MIRTSYKANEKDTSPGEFLWARFLNTHVFRPTMQDALNAVRENIDDQRRNIVRKRQKEEKELKLRKDVLSRKIEGHCSEPDLIEISRQIYKQRLWIRELVKIETDLQDATHEIDIVEARQAEQAVFEGLSTVYRNLNNKLQKRNPAQAVQNHQRDKESFNIHMSMYRDGFLDTDEGIEDEEKGATSIIEELISEKNLKIPSTPSHPILSGVARKIEERQNIQSASSSSSVCMVNNSNNLSYQVDQNLKKQKSSGSSSNSNQSSSSSSSSSKTDDQKPTYNFPQFDAYGCITNQPSISSPNPSHDQDDEDDLFRRFERLNQ